MAISAREAALKAIAAFRRNGAWPEAFLNNIIKKEGLNELDAALSTRLCYGTLQNKLLCDYYISHYSSIKINKIEPQILDILELSVYQLLFMDKIPPSASVNEGVKLSKKTANTRVSGYVNALLRKISDELDNLPEISGKNIEETLSIKHSHPQVLIDFLKGFMDISDIEKFLESNNEIIPITAQINTLKTDINTVVQKLVLDGAEVSIHPWLKDCILIKGGGSLEKSQVFSDGLITVQDAASRLSVMASSPEENSSVLDACSAPGGKSFMAAIMMNNSGNIVSADIHEKKLSRIREGAKRLGISIITTVCMDASVPKPEFFSKYDLVIADVPCSGLGIIRKKPEIRFKNIEELRGLPEVQSRIIENVSKYVKTGGVLMYSTCTIVSDENEKVVKSFLKQHPEFSLEPFVLPEPIGEVKNGMLTLYPYVHGTDGFFMSKMRKK